MTGYDCMVVALLGVAAIINGYQVRLTVLTFISAVILAIVPRALPDPDLLGAAWFPTLISIEFAFACLALSTQTYAGKVIAAFSVLNSLVHGLGWIAYSYDLSIYSQYESIIRFGETSQLLALILFSPLGGEIAQVLQQRKMANHDRDRNKLEYSAG